LGGRGRQFADGPSLAGGAGAAGAPSKAERGNPDALRARFANQMRAYIVDSRISYLADWIGIAEWERWLAPTFAVTVNDPRHNLAVLERRAP
jgi:hypothetical protein